MTDDFDGDNKDDDQRLDAELLKILETYANLDAESAKLNGKRAELRAKADKLGVSSHALQDGVYKLKKQTKAERLADEKATRRLVRAAEGRQAELWPEAVAATEKRAERKKEKAAKAAAAAGQESPEAQERRLAADTNPRSNPKRGGAGKHHKDKTGPIEIVSQSGVTTEESSLVSDQEQAEGAALLDSAIDGMKSQSQLAAEKRAEAGLDR